MIRIVFVALCLAASSLVGQSLQVIVPENATYRYVNATASTALSMPVPPDWFEPAFDDSSWSQGPGAFGGGFGTNLANSSGPGTPNASEHPNGTAWSVNYDPYLRLEFSLPAPMALTLWIAVDNGVESLYLNGFDSNISFNAEGQAFRWENVIDVPAALTTAGTNVLALQLEDHGGATGFAMVITDDDPAVNPTFTTEVCAEAPYRVTFGSGHAGAMGVPSIDLSADPTLGTSLDLLVSNSDGVTKIACGVAGWVQATVPTSIGGTLLIDPDASTSILFEMTLLSNGGTLPLVIPNDPGLCGLELLAQVVQYDPFASDSFAFTPGLRVRFGD